MKTDYPGHDRVYRSRRTDPNYAGWTTHDEFAEYLRITWQPLIRKKAFPKQGRLIELGCGAGNVGIYMAQQGYEVTGVDIAPTAISWAIENAATAGVDVTFLLSDVTELCEIADESFEIALDGNCFHCIIGDDRARFLKAARRILKPGGTLAILSMCDEVPETFGHFDPQSRCLMREGVAIRYIGDSDDIVREVIHAGFVVSDVEVVPPRHRDDLADLILIAEKR